MNEVSRVSEPLFLHGGARRHAGEVSLSLNRRQCRALIDAALRAAAQGKPFNRFITILWDRSGLADADATAASRKFIKLASDWFRDHDERCRWAYVHEWGRVNKAHVHILLHVPRELKDRFRGRPLHWTKSILRGNYVSGTTKTKPVSGGEAPDNVLHDLYGHSCGARIHYMLKAAPRELELELGVVGWGRSQWGQTGRVFGKRAGVWQERRAVRRLGDDRADDD